MATNSTAQAANPVVENLAIRPRSSGWNTLRPRVGRRLSPGYSRFVSLMKVILPLVAALLIALVAAWPHLQPKDTRFSIGFSALTTTLTGEPAMVNPRYFGTDKDAQLFSVTADLAKNVLDTAAAVELEMPKADVLMQDQSWLVLTSNTGVYNRKAQTLDLLGDVNLFHDSGYEFTTNQAYVDLQQGIAMGVEPIRGQGPFGALVAEGFRLEDKGKIIVFTGKSSVTLYPGMGKKSK